MTGTNESTETNARDATRLLSTVRKGHDVTLSDDVIVAIGSTLEWGSLISLVKAFSGIKRYASLYERLTRIPRQFNLLDDAPYKADVLTHFKCVTLVTGVEDQPNVDEDYFKYLTGVFPGYLFEKKLDKSTLTSFDALPDAITRLTMDIDANSRGHAAPKRWPAKLAELKINVKVAQLLCKPPSTLKRFALHMSSFCEVFIDAPLDLEYFSLVGAVSLETNHSISVTTLEVLPHGIRYILTGNEGAVYERVWALINLCKGLQRVVTDDHELPIPPQVREIEYIDQTSDWEFDERTTSIDQRGGSCYYADAYPHLTSLSYDDADECGSYFTPATVTHFKFWVSGHDTISGSTFFKDGFENPAGVVSLFVNCPYERGELPSFKEWHSLKELIIEEYPGTFDLCLEAPNIETVCIDTGVKSITGQSLRRLDMCCPVDKKLPQFPNSLDWLRLRKGYDRFYRADFESTVELHAKRLVELYVDGTPIENVYYDSECLRFVDNLNLKYIGPIGSSGTSKLPPYSLKWLGEKMKDYEFDASTPQLTLKINRDWDHELPTRLVMIELEISADYNLEDLAKMWAQTPKLKHITLKSEGDFSEAWLPSSAEYVNIAFKNTEQAKMKLNFDGGTTSLKWLTLENHQYDWESIGGQNRHPNYVKPM
ncbi:hypothetical protein DICA0_D13806 [Diutina catenulata]